jgi:hypothetical protein
MAINWRSLRTPVVITSISLLISFCPLSSLFVSPLFGSNHYTQKQLDAFASRVNKTYWIVAVEGKTASFLTAPSIKASTFRGEVNESFEITELVGLDSKNPFYKVRFASGNIGYLRPEDFLEEFNARIVASDPLAEEKKKRAANEEEEKKRTAWIRSQPWSETVKEAAIHRQATPGMSATDVKKIVGEPQRMIKVKARNRTTEERWLYTNGSTLIFSNGILSRVEAEPRKDVP